MKYNNDLSLAGNLRNLFGVNGTLCDSQIFDLMSRLKADQGESKSQLSEITKMLVESSMMRRNINSSVQALIEIATAPDATQPQLNEIRYVLHGDIQPCTVLYSDDTTTLLRLDEGDVMCETDTIEWSDSVTYRCQELLRGGAAPLRVIKHLAQLVRDERILLNDDALEASGTGQPVVQARKPDESAETVEVHTIGEKEPRRVPPYHGTSVTSCEVCTNVYDSTLDLCPQCHTPKGLVSLDDTDEETGEAAEQKRIVDRAQNNPSVQLRPKCHTPKER